MLLPHALLSPSSGGDDYSVMVEREANVLCGVIEHLLPKVGPYVTTLDLANGKAVSNEAVRCSTVLFPLCYYSVVYMYVLCVLCVSAVVEGDLGVSLY